VCRPVTAFIALGSNIDPEKNVVSALDALAERVFLEAISTFYWTEALGECSQPPFLNGACRITTVLPPKGLKYDVLRSIETELGRVRTENRYAPRPIDLDIALYGDCVVNEPGLHIPDPDIRNRPFVAVPLLELDPDLALPDTGELLSDIVKRLDTRSLVPAKGIKGLSAG
jgi:2-amino-4-hydroxy-6-hydroxymethyldihydropteridine diphosphokinase